MAKTQLKPLALALGATLVAGMATTTMAATNAVENPFVSETLESGYKVLAEGKCGEGKCGGKKAEGKCGEGKKAEGKCGEGKKAEGKCGEGKCGGKAKSDTKKAEGKCGEGKCGGKS